LQHKQDDNAAGRRRLNALVPGGAPAWVTPQLIADTIETWQGDYDHELTPDDALEILLLFDELVGVLEKTDAE
jgi:hypothetical protein